MLKKRLLWQLYPSYLLITIAAVATVAFFVSLSLRRFYHAQVAGGLEARAHLIEAQVRSPLIDRDYAKIQTLCKDLGKASSTRITVILPGGRVVGDSDEAPQRMKNHADRVEFIEAAEIGRGESLRFSSTLGKNMMYMAIGLRENGSLLAVVRTSMPATAIDAQLADIYARIFIAVLAVAVVAAVISLLVARRITKPVESIRRTAQRFAAGEFDTRAPLPKPVELAELAKAFNLMAEQLQGRIDTITRQRNESAAILSSMSEGVLAVNATGSIVSINAAAAEFLNVDRDQAHGHDVQEVVRNGDVRNFIARTLKSEQTTFADIFLPGEKERFVQLHGTRLTKADNGRSGAVIVMNDVTKVRRLETVRRDFVSNVSHELKTPVTSIKGFVETLMEGAIDEPEEARRFLTIVGKHAERLNAIIEDLLSLSRLEEDSEKRNVSFEIAPMKPILTSAVELSKTKAEAKGIKITVDCPSDVQAPLNAILIEQAIVNLVDNAIKYSRDASEIRIICDSDGRSVSVSVQDNGCGIAQKHLERIFERFYVVDKGRSRKLGGTGLGLAIVKHIAQVHGGSVSVQSTLGKGSTFTINLPIQ